MTSEVQQRYEHYLSELRKPRPISPTERAQVAEAAFEEAVSDRKVARLGLALAVFVVMAAAFFVIPAEVGLAYRALFAVTAPIAVFVTLMAIAIVFGSSWPMDAAFAALASNSDLRNEANTKAYPPEVGAEELAEVAGMIERHAELAPIVGEWLDRGAITLPELTALRYAANAGDQAVAAHAAIQRLRGHAANAPSAAGH